MCKTTMYVIAPTGGTFADLRGSVAVDRPALTTQSVKYACLVVAGGASADDLTDNEAIGWHAHWIRKMQPNHEGAQ